MNLTDVAGLSVDAAAANLKTGTITVHSDHASRITITHLARGTQVLEHGRKVATAGRAGTAAVTVPSGTTVLTLVRPRAAHRPSARRTPARVPSFTG